MRTLVKACAALGLAVLVSSGCGGSHSTKKTNGDTSVDDTSVEEIAHEAADECDDGKDNDGDGFKDCDDLDCRTEATQHCRFAPALDRTVPTNLRDATSFLYTAPDPVQKDLDQKKLEARRLSVIHGKVIGPKGRALRDVRVTEYPFDTETPPMPGGSPRFLPGSLSSSGSVTYSLEFTVDEAVEFEAKRIEFSRPVAYCVENFLGLPAGSPVPLRSCHPGTGESEVLEAGRVVEVVGVQDRKAELDIDGDGGAAHPGQRAQARDGPILVARKHSSRTTGIA